ncbi:YciI-like protein [Mesorhizobium sp. IMUNJ 23232]|uniref:YciI-like protein n=1 Tax=Mesorhizobium sp. IMUNJ 23232 TaxID=3376064 RepID=UPI0037A50775
MIFVFTCKDKPGHLQTRVDNRPTHVEYLNKLNAEGRLKFAGPFLDGDGKPCGSLVAVEAADLAAAKEIAANDPFSKVGLFESVTVQQWNWVFNNPAA